MDLERLPPELISHILRVIDSPRHLYRLLSASPVCLRVFSQSPTIIISSIIKNIIPSYALNHYLVLLNIPAQTGELQSWVREQLDPFLQLYFKPVSFDWPTNMTDLSKLCSIHNRLSYFLSGYLDKISVEFSPISNDKNAYNSKDSDISHDNTIAIPLPPFPSKSEDFRLRRAFLRFELYCRIFSVYQEGWQYAVVAPADQFNLFLAHLEPWEVEEICCIYQYFASTVTSYINELEDRFIAATLDYTCVSKHTAPGPRQPSPEPCQIADEEEKNITNVKNLELGGLKLFSKDFNRVMPHCVSSLVSLGFDFLYELMRATQTRRGEMIRANYHILQDFLPHALQDDPIFENEIVQPDNENDDPLYINLGYRTFSLADGSIYLGILDDGFEYSFLRHLGYVFWDSERIRHPFVNQRLWHAKEAEWEELQALFGRSHHESAEERLGGIFLPQKVLSQLEREFGGTRSTYLGYPEARGSRYFGEEWFNNLAA